MANLKELYNALKADGAPLPDTFDKFYNYMTAPGQEGYKNRFKVYDALKNDGAPLPDTYEAFSQALFKPVPSGTAAATPAGDVQSLFKPVDNPAASVGGQSQSDKPFDRKKAMTEVAQMERQIDNTVADWKEYSANMSEYNKGNMGSVTPQTVKGKQEYNPETGKFEQQYLTPTGGKTSDKTLADMDTQMYREANRTIDEQIALAQKERDELSKKAQARYNKLTEKKNDPGFLESIMSSGDAMTMSGVVAAPDMQAIYSDAEYQQYNQAIREINERIQTLENRKIANNSKEKGFWGKVGDFALSGLELSLLGPFGTALLKEKTDNGKDGVGFWRGFRQTVSNPETWLANAAGALGAVAKMDASVQSIGSESESARALKKAMADNQEVQEKYGDFGFMYRAGVMTGEMAPFIFDFAATGGGYDAINFAGKAMAKLSGKWIAKNAVKELGELGIKEFAKQYGAKGLGKAAAEAAGDWTIKALGTTADELLVRAPLMTNTIQAGKTAADIVDRKLGDVKVDENGNYDFTNDKTWGEAVWQGEANAIIENYSEMFGTHLDGVGKLAQKVGKGALEKTFGAKRIGGMLARMSSSDLGKFMKDVGKYVGVVNKHLQRAGVSDYFGEVGEEYYGQAWRTALNLDDAYNADGTNLFLDGQFHGDIWGGMGLSIGLIGAGKYATSGVAYADAKHQVNKADNVASFIFGRDKWNSIRDIIDRTPNEDIGGLADAVFKDKQLSPNERAAVMNYVERSMNFRGLNLGELAKRRGAEPSMPMTLNDEFGGAFLAGYESATDEGMESVQNAYMQERQAASQMFEPELIDMLDSQPVETVAAMQQSDDYTQEQKDAARSYVNAKAARDGAIQRANDDVDVQIACSDAAIDARTNRTTGMIQPASIGADGRQVFIVDGYVGTNDDGTVNVQSSDESIIVRDAQTGEVEFTTPKEIVGVGAQLEPDTEKANAAKDIRMQSILAKASGGEQTQDTPFALNSEYTLRDEGGNLIHATVVQGVDDDGKITVSTDWPINGNRVNHFTPDEFKRILDKYSDDPNAGGAGGAAMMTDGEQAREAGRNITEQQDMVNSARTLRGKGACVCPLRARGI